MKTMSGRMFLVLCAQPPVPAAQLPVLALAPDDISVTVAAATTPKNVHIRPLQLAGEFVLLALYELQLPYLSQSALSR